MTMICGDEPGEGDLYTAFGLSQDYSPGIECVRQGFELFWKKHARVLRDVPAKYALNTLGKDLWLQRRAEQETEMDDDDIEPDEMHESVWKPESVAGILEANVIKSTHRLRRARWLVWLTESTIAWEEADNSEKGRILLIFENGEVIHRENLISGEDIPAPPGNKKRFNERQHSFDLMTLDRMRVVTTEIRKIVSTGDWIRVRFSPEIVLDGSMLARILKWI